ncbi:MAG TPA: GDYXXLXY domain-containing protein [Steroidobacteraceae bacterium]|nr:GDYXXLXY domain-containing protein [Steroidobacteraceae bacterium]
MSKLQTRNLLIAAVVLVLGAVNASIILKERIKTEGQRIFFALAPVDPRSLMQGDYMALRFQIVDDIQAVESGSAPLSVDARGIATLSRSPVAGGLRIRYRLRNGQIWLGTNAYFFEEGTAERYEGARFGEFRIDRDSGEAVLVGLADKDLEAIAP